MKAIQNIQVVLDYWENGGGDDVLNSIQAMCRSLFEMQNRLVVRANEATNAHDPDTANRINGIMRDMIPFLQGCGLGTAEQERERLRRLRSFLTIRQNDLMRDALRLSDEIAQMTTQLSVCPGWAR